MLDNEVVIRQICWSCRKCYHFETLASESLKRGSEGRIWPTGFTLGIPGLTLRYRGFNNWLAHEVTKLVPLTWKWSRISGPNNFSCYLAQTGSKNKVLLAANSCRWSSASRQPLKKMSVYKGQIVCPENINNQIQLSLWTGQLLLIRSCWWCYLKIILHIN